MLVKMLVKGWFGPNTMAIDAVRITQHFAVHPTPHITGEFQPQSWSATHIASGLAALSNVPLALAVEGAIAFESIGADWDFDDQSEGRKKNLAVWRRCGDLSRKIKTEHLQAGA